VHGRQRERERDGQGYGTFIIDEVAGYIFGYSVCVRETRLEHQEGRVAVFGSSFAVVLFSSDWLMVSSLRCLLTLPALLPSMPKNVGCLQITTQLQRVFILSPSHTYTFIPLTVWYPTYSWVYIYIFCRCCYTSMASASLADNTLLYKRYMLQESLKDVGMAVTQGILSNSWPCILEEDATRPVSKQSAKSTAKASSAAAAAAGVASSRWWSWIQLPPVTWQQFQHLRVEGRIVFA